MLTLSWQQFRRNWTTWCLALGLFILAGWLIAFCLTGIVDLQQALPQLLAAHHDPTPLFMMPLVFGGITLVLVLKGLIQIILTKFQNEYRLWAVLGATPNQLVQLLATQIALLSSIGALIGWLLATFSVPFCYLQLQQIIGSNWLPSGPFYANY
ncbi:FtsX-like permease family protein [Lactobacillus oligofermentans DSM = LMG 22743] [Lactiplantibacillus mudanjiangensis]|uniref:hypothetical protein n=1 Tax=Lactiplantibacillus mudanjiangensis TaxID=1296538 RepID=UPI00101429DF|nr:FtsX-like permease family protein [Lactobacillus oligofermentans DSM = LMG 22743] [Lactiplantibacillus mudanjiangensis]